MKNIKNIINQLSKNQEFKKLFENGDTSGYSSPQDAELALCKMIAEFNANRKTIDLIFKKSMLYCPAAWDKDNHGEDIIQQAFQSVKKKEIPYFIGIRILKDSVSEYVDVFKLVEWMREKVPFILARDEMSNDTTMYIYQNGFYQVCSEDTYKAFIKKEIDNYNPRLVQLRTVNTVYSLLALDNKCVLPDSFNKDETIINFTNGILKLTTFELVPHSPEFLTTIQIPCAWTGEDTPTPVFDGYLKTLSNNSDDIQKYLLQILGICVSNIFGHRFKKGFFLVGEGNTGKSQYRRLIELLLGEKNCFAAGLNVLEGRFGPSTIFRKRLIGTADMGFISVKEMSTFKLLTGGDSLFADIKGKAPISFIYRGVMLYCANQLPHFSGDTGSWVYDRFSIIPCNNVIPEDKRDPELIEKMYQEKEGIIFKAVMALKEIVDIGYRLVEPQQVIDSRKTYSEDNSVVIRFFKECMVSSAGLQTSDIYTSSTVLGAFDNWCRRNNNGHLIPKAQFKRDLAEYLGTTVEKLIKHTYHGNVIDDFTLSEDAWRMYGMNL